MASFEVGLNGLLCLGVYQTATTISSGKGTTPCESKNEYDNETGGLQRGELHIDPEILDRIIDSFARVSNNVLTQYQLHQQSPVKVCPTAKNL